MTLEKLFEINLINDDTELFIRDNDFDVLAHGNWYQDNVLDFLDAKHGRMITRFILILNSNNNTSHTRRQTKNDKIRRIRKDFRNCM